MAPKKLESRTRSCSELAGSNTEMLQVKREAESKDELERKSPTVVGCFCHLSLTMFPFKHTDPVCKGVRTRDFSSERSS